ncbi:anti-sigma factor antagonist [Streptomyces dangxiongensis]|uniref:Anti-sigma factor antagonist n=1 Tax=Streptomyces dangxiongensis TaxID=1442032 RepID=A0A3G2J7L1_9ACTN|nr:STAS domain-containing protein [Streptomyces dangxiongensis]AYN38124.1 anti-sigma factor antagonist [Streptomyces dangxiongensis]
MTTPLTLTPGRRPDGTPRLAVSGEIDMSNVDSLADALDAGSGPLVLDLTAVGYLDSAGLSVLFAHADRLELIAPPLLEPVLTVSGLAGLTTVRGPDEAPPR